MSIDHSHDHGHAVSILSKRNNLSLNLPTQAQPNHFILIAARTLRQALLSPRRSRRGQRASPRSAEKTQDCVSSLLHLFLGGGHWRARR